MFGEYSPDDTGRVNDVPETDHEWSESEAYDGDWQGVLADEADPEEAGDIDDNEPGVHVLEVHEPEPGLHISSKEELEAEIRRLGRGVAEESVVIASGAAYMALGDDVRLPKDVDLAISPGAYSYVRQQEGWQEGVDGRLRVGTYDVGIGWGTKSFEDLHARSWQTQNGIRVASLSDVTDWKNWERGSEKDLADVQALRDRLLDPTKPPLPNEAVAREMELARSCLPEHLRDDPSAQVAIELTANGLATVRALYGDDRIGRPQPIIGSLERPEYGVVATYHNGFGLPADMRVLQRHMDNIGAADEERLRAMTADAYSDIAYGNGRRSDNPESYDELRSADLLGAHVAGKGYDPARVELHRESVLGTTFTEGTGEQAGRHHPDRVVRAVAGVDLQISISEREAVPNGIEISFEDGLSARYSKARTIGRAAAEQGVHFSSIEEGLEFVDSNPNLKPSNAPDGPTVREALGRRMVGSAGFIGLGGYAFPDGWTLEKPEVRRENELKMRGLGEKVLNGDMTAREAYNEAQEYGR